MAPAPASEGPVTSLADLGLFITARPASFRLELRKFNSKVLLGSECAGQGDVIDQIAAQHDEPQDTQEGSSQRQMEWHGQSASLDSYELSK